MHELLHTNSEQIHIRYSFTTYFLLSSTLFNINPETWMKEVESWLSDCSMETYECVLSFKGRMVDWEGNEFCALPSLPIRSLMTWTSRIKEESEREREREGEGEELAIYFSRRTSFSRNSCTQFVSRFFQTQLLPQLLILYLLFRRDPKSEKKTEGNGTEYRTNWYTTQVSACQKSTK